MTETQPTIYQFRLTVKDISPLIWRRVWLRGDQTLSDLHYAIQISMGWTDSYLNQFNLRGKNYCVYQPGGFMMEDAEEAIFQEIQLHPNECIEYQYNMYVPWRVQIRFEKMVPFQASLIYPYCAAGKHAGPVEYHSSSDEYQAKRDYFTEDRLALRVLDAYHERDDQYAMERFEEEVRHFRFWLREHCFDRKAINATLKTYSVDGEWWVPL